MLVRWCARTNCALRKISRKDFFVSAPKFVTTFLSLIMFGSQRALKGPYFNLVIIRGEGGYNFGNM